MFGRRLEWRGGKRRDGVIVDGNGGCIACVDDGRDARRDGRCSMGQNGVTGFERDIQSTHYREHGRVNRRGIRRDSRGDWGRDPTFPSSCNIDQEVKFQRMQQAWRISVILVDRAETAPIGLQAVVHGNSSRLQAIAPRRPKTSAIRKVQRLRFGRGSGCR